MDSNKFVQSSALAYDMLLIILLVFSSHRIRQALHYQQPETVFNVWLNQYLRIVRFKHGGSDIVCEDITYTGE
jgi:hypothetical protein